MRHSRELADVLLRKAEQDEFALDKLIPDPNSPDEIIGFHAQQAIEKMLKAVLASAAVRYRYTHDLVELLDLLRKNSIACPKELEERHGSYTLCGDSPLRRRGGADGEAVGPPLGARVCTTRTRMGRIRHA